MGVPFADFLAPGLIVMGMIQNAFANSSFSLLVGKIQGTIVDYLMPPLVDRRADRRPARRRGDPRLPGRLRGLAGDAALAGRPRHAAPSLGGLLVRADGQHDARPSSACSPRSGPRSSTMPRRSPISSSRRSSLLSGTFYSIDSAVAGLPGDQPRQPLLLRHFGLPLRLPRRGRFAGRCSARLLLLAHQPALGALCYALLRSGWKLKPDRPDRPVSFIQLATIMNGFCRLRSARHTAIAARTARCNRAARSSDHA